MTKAAAISVAGGDLGGSEGPAMVPAHKGHKQGLTGRIAHQFHRVLDGLGAPDIELHAPSHSEGPQTFGRQPLGHQDLFFVEILARQLGQLIELRLERIHNALIAIAEVYRRVPHLEIQVWFVVAIIEKAALAALKELGNGRVVHCIAMRAILRFFFAQRRFAESMFIDAIHSNCSPSRKRRSVTSVRVSNGLQAILCRSHHSRSLPLAKTCWATVATHRSDRPSPMYTVSINENPLDAAAAHLHVPAPTQQSGDANGKPSEGNPFPFQTR